MSDSDKKEQGENPLALVPIEEMAKEIGRRSQAYCLAYLDPDIMDRAQIKQFWSSDNKYILTAGLVASLFNTVTEHYGDGEKIEDE